MKEKTLYRNSEYDADGGGHVIVFVKEDGKVSYRFGGWNSKRRHKYNCKLKKKRKIKQKVLGKSWKGNKSKSFVLESGYIDGWSWFFVCTVLTNGSFHDKGSTIHIQYCETECDKERRRQLSLKYWYEHREEITIKQKIRYREHQEELREKRRNYYKDHCEKEIQNTIDWQRKNPEKAKILMKRHQNKRRRQLGFIPLNSPFEDSQAHHIDKNLVIFIPTKLHQSISHNVFSGKGMVEINGKVLIWLGKINKKGDDKI